jgi:hypothetical protein
MTEGVPNERDRMEIDEKWGMPHVPYNWDGSASYWDGVKWKAPCSHEFVDTGTLKSFCKKCDVGAVWDSTLLKFVAKEE